MKRLYKSSRDKKMAGVCGGVAEYFNIDSVIVRAVFAVMFFAYGVGFLPYIVLAMVMPYDYEVNGGTKPHTGFVQSQTKTQHRKDVTNSVTNRQEDDEWSDF